MKSKCVVLTKLIGRDDRPPGEWELKCSTPDQKAASEIYNDLACVDEDMVSIIMMLYEDGFTIPISCRRKCSKLTLLNIYNDAAMSQAAKEEASKIANELPF